MNPIAPSRAETRREQRRAHFHSVARELFLDQGYETTTIEQISNRAGYSKRTVYLYFDTKHELFCAVLRPELLKLQERLSSVVNSDDDGHTQLVAMAREYVAFSQDRSELFSLLVHFEAHEFYRGRDRSGLPVYAAACLEINERMSERVDEIIRRGMADGSIQSKQTPAQLNLMFWAAASGILQVCRQRAAVLESHYGITGTDLLDAFIDRFLSVRMEHGDPP